MNSGCFRMKCIVLSSDMTRPSLPGSSVSPSVAARGTIYISPVPPSSTRTRRRSSHMPAGILVSIGMAQQACNTSHAVPLEVYLGRMFGLSPPARVAELQRVLCKRVRGQGAGSCLEMCYTAHTAQHAWPPVVAVHGQWTRRLLCSRPEPSSKASSGAAPLHCAILNSHIACVAALLEANAAVDIAWIAMGTRRSRSRYTGPHCLCGGLS